MEDIAYFWGGQPDIARDFLRVLVFFLLAALIRSLFPLARILRRSVPHSLVLAMKKKAEAPDAAYTNVQAAEEAFTKLHESVVADAKLIRFIGSLMIVSALAMVWFSASAVAADIARLTRFDGSYTLHVAVHLLQLLGVGLALCTPLYAVANALEYLLQRRKIQWRRVLADARRMVPDTNA